MPTFETMKGLRYAAISHPGMVRTRNEDSWGVFQPGETALLTGEGEHGGSLEMGANGLVLLVSDGMGGAKAGDYASRTIVKTLHERLGEKAEDRDGLVRATLEIVHRRLIEESKADSEKEGMGGTCSLAWLDPNGGVMLVHVGDSRIYRYRKGELAQLTEDQTVAAQFIASGEITEAEARNNRYWHVLIQAIGGGEDRPLEPQVRFSKIKPGDRLLLCTDGITDGLLDPQLLELIQLDGKGKPLEGGARTLLEAALEASGRDNATFILAEVF
jgi:protein phosphatase